MKCREGMTRLKPEEDAFGQLLWALHDGSEVFEIIERDDGYVDAMNAKGYFSEYEDWPQIEKEAMSFVTGRVLDVGCGAGRHSLYLQKKGLDVTGIDVSPIAIKVCRLRGLKKVKHMAVEKVDFKTKSLDTIIMMGLNFGLFGSFKKAKRLLRKFHRMTSENAVIVADIRDPYKTSNLDHLAYHKRNRERGRMGGQVRIRVRFRRNVGRWFDYLMVSKEEMKEILRGTGWKVRRFINSQSEGDACYVAVIGKAC
jgi:SAM-dependent methyltransferase